MCARLVRLGSIIEAVGFEGLPSDTVKHLEDRLWELRIRGKSGIARAIWGIARANYVMAKRKNRHRAGLVKKTQKTPRRDW